MSEIEKKSPCFLQDVCLGVGRVFVRFLRLRDFFVRFN